MALRATLRLPALLVSLVLSGLPARRAPSTPPVPAWLALPAWQVLPVSVLAHQFLHSGWPKRVWLRPYVSSAQRS